MTTALSPMCPLFGGFTVPLIDVAHLICPFVTFIELTYLWPLVEGDVCCEDNIKLFLATYVALRSILLINLQH